MNLFGAGFIRGPRQNLKSDRLLRSAGGHVDKRGSEGFDGRPKAQSNSREPVYSPRLSLLLSAHACAGAWVGGLFLSTGLDPHCSFNPAVGEVRKREIQDIELRTGSGWFAMVM